MLSELFHDHIAWVRVWCLLLMAHFNSRAWSLRFRVSAMMCCNIRMRHSIWCAIVRPIPSLEMPPLAHVRCPCHTQSLAQLPCLSVLKLFLITQDRSNPLSQRCYSSPCLVAPVSTIWFHQLCYLIYIIDSKDC